MSEENHGFVPLMQKLRMLDGDPSAWDDFSLEPGHMEVVYRVKAETGVEFQVQSTRHSVVYYLDNENGYTSISFDADDFEVEGVCLAILEEMEGDAIHADSTDFLSDFGYNAPQGDNGDEGED